uniref:Uncharacterized protein n=1 Tax=Physcomitrium patens TaxID=3218 RepID=A0A2K1L1J9_PHYPA|nr:hypothetical protein PHYPA_002696 [Physcomitrium patens]
MVIRLDIGVVPAFKLQKRQGMSPPLHGEPGDTSKERRHPILALSYQQQLVCPLRALVGSRVSVNS